MVLVNKFSLPLPDREDKQVLKLSRAGVSQEKIRFVPAVEGDLQRCFEVGHTAVEQELLVLRGFIGRLHAQEGRVRFARGEVMNARGAGWNHGGEVCVSAGRQDANTFPLNPGVRNAFPAEQRGNGKSRLRAGLSYKSVERRGQLVGWEC